MNKPIDYINRIIENTRQINKQKQKTNFFENTITNYFDGHRDLYIGDIDFKFADENVNVIAEIKTISKNGQFEGKKVSLNQIREYASMSDLKDNLGRITKTYIFEYHKYKKTPFVIVVPIVYNANGKNPNDYIDLNKSKMLYIHKDNQLSKWLEGTFKNSFKPQKPLLCI